MHINAFGQLGCPVVQIVSGMVIATLVPSLRFGTVIRLASANEFVSWSKSHRHFSTEAPIHPYRSSVWLFLGWGACDTMQLAQGLGQIGFRGFGVRGAASRETEFPEKAVVQLRGIRCARREEDHIRCQILH